ncbi:endonuclease III [Candidatus Magnetominusculus dajiuhuensis]|uniref:endonuclease III n=1 Tax=Candidatus Magnetominusculus dajiuhuensis TaxID=3137712 RepID=UPI003B439762
MTCKLNKDEIDAVAAYLRQRYPQPKTALQFSNPFELLVATILSAQCTDKRVNIVVKTLFERYKSVEDYAAAEPAAFEEEIKSTGFYKNKTKMIIGAAKAILSDFNGVVPATMEELVTLPGVGRKTASVVLAAAFGVPAIAVDTHVLRISNRLGLVNSKDPEKIEAALCAIFDRDKWIGVSFGLVLFGREICSAKKPLCDKCGIYSVCKWPEKKTPLPT